MILSIRPDSKFIAQMGFEPTEMQSVSEILLDSNSSKPVLGSVIAGRKKIGPGERKSKAYLKTARPDTSALHQP